MTMRELNSKLIADSIVAVSKALEANGEEVLRVGNGAIS